MNLLVLSFGVLCAFGNPDVERVLQHHESGLSGIYSFKATVDGRFSEDGGKSWVDNFQLILRKSGSRDRFHWTSFGLQKDGKWERRTSHVEFGFTPSETRVLYNLDPSHPPTQPLRDMHISGKIR